MPRISSTPSVKTFVSTWSADFEVAMKKAAGKNGKLTLAEAKKLAASGGPDTMFADNALTYMKANGLKSVLVDELTRGVKATVQRAAEAAAGPDGKLSLADGAKLPKDLFEDFFVLRGKPVPGSSAMPQVKAALLTATKDLLMPSETDATFVFMNGKPLNGAAITPAVVRAHLTPQHDALISSVMYTDPSERSLKKKTPVETLDGSAFLERLATNFDPNDPTSVANAKRFAALKKTLESQLTDLTVFRFGTVSISTFIVGRTKDGELAGLLTGQVET